MIETNMRWTLALAVSMVSVAAYADPGDTKIHIDYHATDIRVRPDPGIMHPHESFDIVLHPDGKIEDVFLSPGKHPVRQASDKRRLGATATGVEYRVLNQTTIIRTGHQLVTTISVHGKDCSVKIRPKLPPTQEYETESAELGTTAVYRDLRIVDASCRIE